MDTNSILRFLEVTPAAPDNALLDALVSAYVRHVPWESVSRVAAKFAGASPFPRWPEIFWQQALDQGAGGTCFESNYAFFDLLQNLGYSGYLTVNNMGESIGCHTAIVIELADKRWLVDAGLPLYLPLPLEADAVTSRDAGFQSYKIRPLGDQRYAVERYPHAKPVAFTLIDQPVNDADYRAATVNDYGDSGLFLQEAVINKVVDEAICRFNSREEPPHLETFHGNQRIDQTLTGDIAAALGQRFRMDAGLIRQALEL